MSRHERLTRTGAGVLVAGVAIFLVAALLSAAIYSASAANQVNSLVHHQLADANKQLDMLRASDANQAALTQARSALALKQRRELAGQNKLLLAQNRAIAQVLRSHGIPVPDGIFTTQGQQPSNRPKVPHGHRPHHHGPGTPGPPPGTPSPGTITELCALIPMLCP